MCNIWVGTQIRECTLVRVPWVLVGLSLSSVRSEGIFPQAWNLPSLAGSQIQGTPSIPRKSRRRKSLAIAYEAGQDDGAEPPRAPWEPRDWREQLERIREMRRSRDAPVDEMGVQKCYDSNAPPQVTAFPQGTASTGNSISTHKSIHK